MTISEESEENTLARTLIHEHPLVLVSAPHAGFEPQGSRVTNVHEKERRLYLILISSYLIHHHTQKLK